MIGRATMTIGLLVLAFSAYQLWGTGLREAEAQQDLADRLAAELAGRAPAELEADAAAEPEPGRPSPLERPRSPADGAEPAGGPLIAPEELIGPDEPAGREQLGGPDRAIGPRPQPEPAIGDPFASIRIPAIGVDKTVVEGTTREALRTGPGHYLGTARPGQRGNVAIAGHRTTYGAPFHDIDQLQPGDEIVVETTEGVFTYRVEGQQDRDGNERGHRIVAPEQVEVIADRGDHRLTLTACHPLYSARQRIVVTALLDGPAIARPTPAPVQVALPVTGSTELVDAPGPISAEPSAAPGTENPVPAEIWAGGDDLGWQTEHAGATTTWAALTSLIAAAGWALGRLWRRVPAAAVTAPGFTLALVTCFAHLDRLLPAA